MKSPLHFFSVTKSTSFSFLLSITCSSPVIILANLHKTHSNTPLFLTMDSRCHLKIKHCCLYSCYCSLACRSCWALHEHTATASSYYKSHHITYYISIPHLFLQSYFLDTQIPHKSGLFYPRCRILNLPVSTFKKYLSAHSLVLFLCSPTTQNTNHYPQFGLTTDLKEILSHHPRH